MEKSLPPLPSTARTRKPPPLRLPPRAHVPTQEDQKSGELERLRRKTTRLEEEQDKMARLIAELTLQNEQYRAQSKSHRQLVVRIANTISDAFNEYRDSLQSPPPSNRPCRESAATSNKRGNFEYEDALTAWSHSESSS
ncbi:hypothetical protein F5Y17DRAFT_269637 [Xylariaceae sp. FL0594]|nr:hypothetical protein F5Y17DRAFT_269637 [Xylariaceae sp. FL0594]